MGLRVNDKSRWCHVLLYPLDFDFGTSLHPFLSVPTRFLSVEAKEEIWALKEPFRISRGSRTEARVIVVTVSDGKDTGRGEGVPLARYSQNIASVLAQI